MSTPDQAKPATGNLGVLEEMTLEQVRQLDAQVVVLPLGSTEPHGPHLPYGTDSFFIEAVCRDAVVQANAAGGRVVMFPTLRITNNANFQAFPFACRIGVRTLMQVVADIVQSLEQDGIRKIVLVNGHGGNEILQGVLREHVGARRPGEGAFLCLIHAHGMANAEVRALIEHPSDHAGELETSCMMHLCPELVRVDKLGDFPRRQPALEGLGKGQVQFVRQWHLYLPQSAGGETRTSDARKGRLFTEAVGRGMAAFLAELSQAPWHANFPYAPA